MFSHKERIEFTDKTDHFVYVKIIVEKNGLVVFLEISRLFFLNPSCQTKQPITLAYDNK